MDLDGPSSKYLFIRLDKLQDHNVKMHSGQLCMASCMVGLAQTLYPSRCAICQCRFRSQCDRASHITKQHSGNRMEQVSTHKIKWSQNVTLGCEESEVGLSVPFDRGNGSEHPTPSVAKHRHSWDGEILSDIPTPDNMSVVCFRPLAASTHSGTSAPDSRLVAVQWSDEIQGEGAFGKVVKVKIALDHQWEHPSEPREFACRHMWSHDELFEQEVRAFASLPKIRPRPAIVECYGTFDHLDSEGRPTRNLLLEHAEGNLWQYWCRTSPPQTYADVVRFYAQLFNLSGALSIIHQISDTEDGQAVIRHGDLKPENILRFPSDSAAVEQWKLADFGLSRISLLSAGTLRSPISRSGGRLHMCQGASWAYSESQGLLC